MKIVMILAAASWSWVSAPEAVDRATDIYRWAVTFTQTTGKNFSMVTAGVFAPEVRESFLGGAQ